MKIKFKLDDDNMIIVVRSVFHEGNKYYHKVFLDFYKS